MDFTWPCPSCRPPHRLCTANPKRASSGASAGSRGGFLTAEATPPAEMPQLEPRPDHNPSSMRFCPCRTGNHCRRGHWKPACAIFWSAGTSMAKISIFQVLHTVCITSRQSSGCYVAEFLMPVTANVTGPHHPRRHQPEGEPRWAACGGIILDPGSDPTAHVKSPVFASGTIHYRDARQIVSSGVV